VERQVLSFAGDQFARVAIAILVYGRIHSPFLTALAYAPTYLPPIAGGPLLSGLADLFRRRRVMIVCDLLRIDAATFAVSALIVLAGFTSSSKAWPCSTRARCTAAR
jgi:MFS family permease